jgi:TetR/AcrR family transcriptional repressor of nem operon
MESVLVDIERKEAGSVGRLRRFVAVLREILRDENRLCLCGILAAEVGTISDQMKSEIRRFFDVCEQWIAGQLQDGGQKGELKLTDPPPVVARAMLSGLEGAMITSRAYGDDRRLEEAASWMLNQLAPP